MYVGIRNSLLETDDHTCPICNEQDVSPNSLVPNQQLRKVSTFDQTYMYNLSCGRLNAKEHKNTCIVA